MSKLKPLHLILISLTLSTMLMACGGQPYQNPQAPAPTPTNSGGNGGSSGGGTGGGSPSNFTPAITFSFNVTGSGGAHPSFTTQPVNTDTILKIKITAGQASNLNIPIYSNFTANYDCVSYTVTALGKSVTTQPLSASGENSALCPNAPPSEIIDFSDRLGPGHGPVTITIDRVRYDFYCKLWTRCQPELSWNPTCYYSFYPATQSMYCPMRTVYRNHTVTGDLAIQVNGSTL